MWESRFDAQEKAKDHYLSLSKQAEAISYLPCHVHHDDGMIEEYSDSDTDFGDFDVISTAEFFCNIGCFDPLCVRSPLDTLESGVLFHIMVVETVTCFTRRSTMESSVVSSLPDRAFTPTPRKHGVEQSTMKHSGETCWNRPTCESHC